MTFSSAWRPRGHQVLAEPLNVTSAAEGCASERHLCGPWPEGQFDRRIVAETDYLETALSMCLAGVGAAYLPALAVREHLAQGRLSVVAEAPGPYYERLYLVWRKGVRVIPGLHEAIASRESAVPTPEAALA